MDNGLAESSHPETRASIADIIDIKKLENENRHLLVLGFIVAFITISAVGPLLSKRKYTHSIVSEKGFHLPVRLVTLIKTPVESETQPEKDRKPEILTSPTESLSEAESPESTEQTAESVDETVKNDPEKRVTGSILYQPPPFRKLPPLIENKQELIASKDDSTIINYLQIPHKIPNSENDLFDIRDLNVRFQLSENTSTIVGPGYGIVYYDPFPDIEEEEDECRHFKYDILGIPIGGKGLAFGVGAQSIFLDVGGVLNSSRHFLKSIVWKVEDMIKEGRIQAHRSGSFSLVKEKDIRFMVLLWRYDRVDPRRISHCDRLYINKTKSEYIVPHFTYLKDMEKRGLASSLKKNGRIVYKANFSRDEILHTFISAFDAIKEAETKDVVLSYIDIINMKTD